MFAPPGFHGKLSTFAPGSPERVKNPHSERETQHVNANTLESSSVFAPVAILTAEGGMHKHAVGLYPDRPDCVVV